jgi:hypothetical protein
MNKKLRKWLETVEICSRPGSGMYRGIQCDVVPSSPALKLERAGFIERFMPHNPVHKDRWIITEEGRAALRA